MTGDELPIVGVVLAAGTSSRFGTTNKLLADLDGKPLVRHAARTLLDARLEQVVVVLGHEATAVRDALARFDVRFADNPDYESGQSTSVRTGVQVTIETDAAAAIFLPGDMPFVDSATVERLLDAYRDGLGDALAPAYAGQRGNPVLFDRRYFDALSRVEGDVGGRSVLLESDDALLFNVDDPGVTTDIDTPSDLSRHTR